ncbi:MAG: hypothetical protein K0B09_07960 [Bacteroidales bacterium]|nr:hypothetical protein [Bacteroidales bacterium]
MSSETFFAIFPGIFINPGRTWEVIRDLDLKPVRFFLFFGLPFVFLGALGRALTDQSNDLYVSAPFGALLFVHLLTHLLVLLVGPWMVARMAGTYGLDPGFNHSMRLAVTAYIPFLLSQIVTAIAAALSFIPMAGLIFSLFLYWHGAPLVLGIPVNRLTGFTLLSFFIFLGLGFIGLYLLRMITFAPVSLH